MAFFSTHSRGRQILTSLKAARPIALLVSEFYRFYWDKKHIFLAETDKLFGVLSFFITVIEGGLLFIFISPAALFGFPVVA